MSLSLRMSLPVGHFVVDCIALGLWLWHANTVYQPKADSVGAWRAPVAFFQEGGSIHFEPRFDSTPEEFYFLAAGNLPAMLVSSTLRPEGSIVTSTKRWDPAWFSIHEGVSFAFWFGIGALFDSGVLRIRKLMVGYLVSRFGFAVFLLLPGIARIGSRLEVLCWFAFGAYLFVLALRWTFSKIRLGVLKHRSSNGSSQGQ